MKTQGLAAMRPGPPNETRRYPTRLGGDRCGRSARQRGGIPLLPPGSSEHPTELVQVVRREAERERSERDVLLAEAERLEAARQDHGQRSQDLDRETRRRPRLPVDVEEEDPTHPAQEGQLDRSSLSHASSEH